MKSSIVLLLVTAATVMAQTPATPPAAQMPAREPGLYATINTTKGAITVKLFEKEAPATVKNFVALSRGAKSWKDPKTGQMVTRPLFPGTIFHRVLPGFMIQGGDPTGTGAYDPGFVIPDEFHPSLRFDQPGRLAMANAGPKTSNSQFFITESPQPHLNGLHTIFGQVIEGQNVVSEIAGVPRDPANKPRTPVRIINIKITREGPPQAGTTPSAKKPGAAPAKKSTPAVKKAGTPEKK